MQGVRLDKDELIDTYGVSRRLAVRIGALLPKGLEVSQTLVEIAGAGSPIEKLLLHRELLEQAETLSSETLKRLAVETGADAEGALALVVTPKARVIALEEELIADEALAGEKKSDTAIIRAEDAGAPARFLDEKERRGLFSRDEIARLKLEALAGRDAEARISALRKLIFAPISDQEKGGICLRALLDRSSEVRAEAIKALESLGFDRDTADAVRRVLEGNERARHAALRRLGDLLGGLHPGEQRIVLAVLVEVFREAHLKGPEDPLLHLLHEAVPVLPAHAEIVPELARVAVQRMLAEPGRLGGVMRDFLAELASVTPELVTAKLWEEAETVRDAVPRALLLGLLVDLDRGAAGRARLCDAITAELLREDVDEVTRQNLGHTVTTLGEDAAETLVGRYDSASNRHRAVLTPFLDILATDRDLSDELRDRIAGRFAGALPTADRPLRAEILRARVFGLPSVDAQIKRALSQELISLLKSDLSGSEAPADAASLLETLGEPAAEGLLDFLKGRPSADAAETAARLLGRVLSRADGSPEAAGTRESAARFLLGRIRQREAPGGYEVALAQLLSVGGMEKESGEALDIFLERFLRSRRLGDLIEAISLLVAGKSVAPEQRVRAVHLMSELLDRPASGEETKMREITSGGAKLFEITGRIEFDSEILPAAVRGLCRIALSPDATAALRDRITAQFVRIWKEVASWRVVWGPRASQTLAETLGEVGADERLPETARAEIVRELGVAVERSSVVRAFQRIFARPSEADEVDEAVVEAAAAMLEQWIQPEISPEELQEVLTAAVAAAARSSLSGRKGAVRKLRERTTRLVLDAMRSGHPWHRPLLEKLKDCPSMPRRLRTRIEEALAQTALVKADL
jgi:hypothetical protein